MTQPLLSTSWYRVAGLRPRLSPQLKVMRQPVRDQLWHVLAEAGTGRQLRLNPAAYEFAGRCDGVHTVGELWSLLLAQLGNDAPSQDDILRLLAQLHRTGMVQFDAAPNLAMLFERRSERSRQRRRAFINPFIVRMRLFDPTRLLDRIEPALRPLMGPTALVVWALCVLAGLLVAVPNLAALRAEAVAHLGTPRSLWLLWLCYPIVKALHELGHALAVRRFGGQVHECGITLMFFTPAPYVDASAANAFERRYQRALVSAAGIMVELLLASLALAVWLAVEPGLVRDAAFVVLLICSVSTLLFNGNPLMRLDGYYILCDALHLPNLALRSNALWSAGMRRLTLGREALPAGSLAAGEFKWLLMYAPLSLAYRVVLLAALVGWAGAKSWLLGWTVALVVIAWFVVPMVIASMRLSAAAGAAHMRGRTWGVLAGLAGAVLLILFVVPVPSSTVARGVVWPPDHAQVRSETAGFVESLPLADGAAVQPGDVLLRLSEPSLVAEHDKRTSQLTGLQAQQYQALLNDPSRAANLAEDITRTEAEVARSEEQLAQLDVRSQAAGKLVLPRPSDLPGSFTPRGTMVGYILGPGPTHVRAVLAEHEVALVRERLRGVQVRLAENPGVVLTATPGKEVPAATHTLPNAALGDRFGGGFGGGFAIDPADKQGLRTVDPVFLLDVTVDAPLAERIGGRAWLRFDLGFEPLGIQWGRQLRQLLLRHFNPVGQA
jgi:putative peptide zinc metalloprotease protein